MDLNTQKEMFSYAYIQAVASVAGYSVELKNRPMDNAGIDVTIEVPREIEAVAFPRIDAQVKCTQNIRYEQQCVKYSSLPVKNYQTLRHPNPYIPIILIVLVVPDDIDHWLNITEKETLLKKCSYWVSLKGKPPTNNKKEITVEIPRQNLFTPISLQTLMEKTVRREEL